MTFKYAIYVQKCSIVLLFPYITINVNHYSLVATIIIKHILSHVGVIVQDIYQLYNNDFIISCLIICFISMGYVPRSTSK